MSDRPLRVCDVCGQIDDHPRHTFVDVPEKFQVNEAAQLAVFDLDAPADVKIRLLEEIADTSTQQRHMDCCREAGCPDGSCNDKPELKGYDLVEAITGEKVAE